MLADATVTTPSTAANTNLGVIWNGNSSKTIWLRELGIVEANSPGAGSVDVGIARLSARGTVTTSIVPVQWDSDDPAPGWIVDSAWSAAPATPSNYLRRICLPSIVSAGKGLVWEWPPTENGKGLAIAANNGLQIYSITSIGTIYKLTMTVEE